jgi:hypothetical protein
MHNIQVRVSRHLGSVSSRMRDVTTWYIVMLLLTSRRNSLTAAAKLSGLAVSCFSSLLAKGSTLASTVLTDLVCKAASGLSRKPIVPGAPWTIAILVDSTLHKRSSTKVSNSQRLNHGQGWVVGHQWTNVVILIDGVCLPLPPLPFYTKAHCLKHGIVYETEHVRLRKFLSQLDLTKIVGAHSAHEVVVLLDSGYDCRDLQLAIMLRGWDLVASMRVSSKAKSCSNTSNNYQQIGDLFQSVRGSWQTVYAFDAKWKKRKDFRARALQGELLGLSSEALLVCSETRQDSQNRHRKYIYCSRLDIDIGVVVRTYRQRWNIELFHKDVKSYLGMEDASVHEFEAMAAHVNWVYAAYTFLNLDQPGIGIFEAQERIRAEYEADKFRVVRRLSDRFGASAQVKSHCSQVIQGLEAAEHRQLKRCA